MKMSKSMKMMLGLLMLSALFVATGCKTMSNAAKSGGVAAKNSATKKAHAVSKPASRPSMMKAGIQGAAALVKLLSSSDAKARSGAKQKLLAMGAKALPALLGVLRKGSSTAKRGALDVIGGMGKKATSAKNDVQQLAKSKDAAVAKAASDTLKKIQ